MLFCDLLRHSDDFCWHCSGDFVGPLVFLCWSYIADGFLLFCYRKFSQNLAFSCRFSGNSKTNWKSKAANIHQTVNSPLELKVKNSNCSIKLPTFYWLILLSCNTEKPDKWEKSEKPSIPFLSLTKWLSLIGNSCVQLGFILDRQIKVNNVKSI